MEEYQDVIQEFKQSGRYADHPVIEITMDECWKSFVNVINPPYRWMTVNPPINVGAVAQKQGYTATNFFLRRNEENPPVFNSSMDGFRMLTILHTGTTFRPMMVRFVRDPAALSQDDWCIGDEHSEVYEYAYPQIPRVFTLVDKKFAYHLIRDAYTFFTTSKFPSEVDLSATARVTMREKSFSQALLEHLTV